jgi:succinoglycan biosynthesis protein ExoL
MRITYLLPVVSQARYHKRVGALERLGAQSEILAFERSYYSGKPWPDGYRSLGQVQHGRYFQRLPSLLKAISTVQVAAQKSDAIYAFGLDTLLISWLATRRLKRKIRRVYEVGDIRQTLLRNGVTSTFLRWLERCLLRQVDLLVVTSEAYVTGYFQGIQGLSTLKYQVIENKVDDVSFPHQKDQMTRHHWNTALRIGYFGLIRCRQSWEILKRVAEKGNGRVEIYVRGISMGVQDLNSEAQMLPYMDYGGPYVAPDDLLSMYGQVDMVWACYPYNGTELGNWRWARTNRFYEACFFQRPIFAQLGTEDGRVVENLGLGISLDLADVERAVERILQVKDADIIQWQQNIINLPREVYILSDEHERLMKALQ